MNNKKTIIIAIATLVVGLLLGWLIFGGSKAEPADEHLHETELADETTWTCSMHPQVRQPEPGDCPICGMDLIPLENEDDDESLDPNAISMSATAMQLANIQTAVVGNMDPVKEVRMNGKVQSDERLIYSQSSHIPGRIEELMVNFTGEYVSKGKVIASIYSPDLVTAQEELFEAEKIKATQPALFRAAKEKLKNWKLTEEQVQQILESGAAMETFDIRADVSGYVTEKMVNTGDYVNRGQAIYEIADLSRVWVLFDVYESDIPWIDRGDEITFTIPSLPGETFDGEISFIDPVIDPKTRVAKARVVVSNPGLRLKPEMLVSGIVEAKLPSENEAVIVPKTAVMWTGERSVVYVKSESEQGVNFILRNVTLGPGLGESYIIEEGVEEGEEIAVHGTFSIDAAAQLAGKPSMMNQMEQTSTEHVHDIPGDLPGEMQHEMEIPDLGEDFRDEFQPVLGQYFSLKDALVQSDLEAAKEETMGISESLTDISNWAEGYAHQEEVEEIVSELKKQVTKIEAAKNIDQARKSFIALSDFMIRLSKETGPFAVPVYVQFCPMANENQGAYWLSTKEQIRNPYYGDMMLTCGEVRDVIKKDVE